MSTSMVNSCVGVIHAPRRAGGAAVLAFVAASACTDLAKTAAPQRLLIDGPLPRAQAEEPPAGVVQVSHSGLARGIPAVSGNRIVWVDGRDAVEGVYVHDVSAGTEQRIAVAGSSSSNSWFGGVCISGDLVGYGVQEDGQSMRLVLRDLSSGEITEASPAAHGCKASGQWVAYASWKATGQWQLFVYDYAARSDVPIPPLDGGAFDIDGSRLVWLSGYAPPVLHWMDLDDATHTIRSLDVSSIVEYAWMPEVSGNLVLFGGSRPGSPGTNSLLLADLSGGTVTVLESVAPNQSIYAAGLSGTTALFTTYTFLGENDHGYSIDQFKLYSKNIFSQVPAEYIGEEITEVGGGGVPGVLDRARVAFKMPSTAGRDVFMYDLRTTAGPPAPPPTPPMGLPPGRGGGPP